MSNNSPSFPDMILCPSSDAMLIGMAVYTSATSAGACRFYVGLADQIKIIDSPEFEAYVTF